MPVQNHRPLSIPPPTLDYQRVASRRLYRKPPNTRALIAGACFIVSLITPAITSTSTSISNPSDPEYTFGWQVAFSTLPLLANAVSQRDWLRMILSLMPFCAQGLLLIVVILEIVPTLFAIESPSHPRSQLAAKLSLAALLPAVLSLAMFRFDPHFTKVPQGRYVSPSLAGILWTAAFLILLLRDWRPRHLAHGESIETGPAAFSRLNRWFQ